MRRMTTLLAAVGAMLVLYAGGVLAQPAQPPQQEGAIPGRYIVVLNDDVSNPGRVANQMAQRHGLEVGHTYRYALKGFSARIPAQRLSAVRADSRVLFIDEDREVQAVHHRPGHGGGGTEPAPEPAPSEPSILWATGVNRIDAENTRTANNGAAVAILDTGIYNHADLNLAGGYNCTSGNPEAYSDGNGHGTHVAGTVGAKDNATKGLGVAPGTSLWAMKVLGNSGSGMRSWVICGIDKITEWKTDGNATTPDIEVANMSLGGSGSDDGETGKTCDTTTDAYRKAICNSVDPLGAGVTYVVAAGNSTKDFKDSAPAAYNEVLTVTAVADFNGASGGGAKATCRSDVDDTAADFSNYTTVGSSDESHTIAAPGVCIESTWNDGGYRTISGTSMASPHVAGNAARCIASGQCTGTPEAIISKLRDDAKAQPESYGFAEDPHKVTAAGKRYYGYLEYAGGY